MQPVTRGARIASFFWIQIMVRDDGQRTLLFDLDMAIQRLNHDIPDHPSTVQVTSASHNRLRHWAEMLGRAQHGTCKPDQSVMRRLG